MELNAGRHLQAGSKLPRKDYEVSKYSVRVNPLTL